MKERTRRLPGRASPSILAIATPSSAPSRRPSTSRPPSTRVLDVDMSLTPSFGLRRRQYLAVESDAGPVLRDSRRPRRDRATVTGSAQYLERPRPGSGRGAAATLARIRLPEQLDTAHLRTRARVPASHRQSAPRRSAARRRFHDGAGPCQSWRPPHRWSRWPRRREAKSARRGADRRPDRPVPHDRPHPDAVTPPQRGIAYTTPAFAYLFQLAPSRHTRELTAAARPSVSRPVAPAGAPAGAPGRW